MHRRGLLTAAGTCFAGGLAGCTDSTSQPEPDTENLERCPRLIVRRSELPEPARHEVDTALEDGEYESETGLYLPHLMDPEESYIQTERDEYYRAIVTEDGQSSRLELERTVPVRDTRAVSFENQTEEQLAVSVHIAWLDGPETVAETSLTIDSGSDAATAQFPRRFGDYRATLETEDWSQSVEWHERELKGSLRRVFITAEELRPEPRAVADTVPCQDYWE